MSDVPDLPVSAVQVKRGKPLWIKLGLVLVVLVLVLGGLWWWLNRPIKPVVLSAPEIEVVEAKVGAIQGDTPAAEISVDVGGPAYEKGSKDIVLTERELNGLLHRNTNLGESVRLELARDAVHARVEMDLDPEIPVVGGKRLKARARFLVSSGDGPAELMLDDLTVWGISLPNEWLGNLKGKNLFGEVIGSGGGIPGVEEIVVEPGRLRVRLKE